MKGHDQLYGLTEMEILLELECGLDVEFTPDWVSTENHADHSKVQWKLQHDADTELVDVVFFEFSPEEPLSRSSNYLEGLRLLQRYDPGGTDSRRS